MPLLLLVIWTALAFVLGAFAVTWYFDPDWSDGRWHKSRRNGGKSNNAQESPVMSEEIADDIAAHGGFATYADWSSHRDRDTGTDNARLVFCPACQHRTSIHSTENPFVGCFVDDCFCVRVFKDGVPE